MNILITGATGFIGKYLLQQLIEEGHYCRCLVRRSSNRENLFNNPKVEIFEGDITKPETLKGIGKEIDVVYHLAAAGHVADVSEDAYKAAYVLNVQGTQNIIEACATGGFGRFIHFSSTAAMGLIKRPIINEDVPCQPQTPYQKSKYESEKIAFETGNKYEVDIVVLRPCMVYGPGGRGEFLKFCSLIKKGLFPRIGLGKNLTPIVHLKDVVQAALKAATKGNVGNVYLIASETSPPLRDIFEAVCLSLGIKRPYYYVPLWAAYSAALLGEKLSLIFGKPPIVSRKNILSVAASRVFDISKAKRDLDYGPSVNLELGIKQTIDWYRKESLI